MNPISSTESLIQEKMIEDYLYNIRLAQFWYKIRTEEARVNHKHHLEIARDINSRFIQMLKKPVGN